MKMEGKFLKLELDIITLALTIGLSTIIGFLAFLAGGHKSIIYIVTMVCMTSFVWYKARAMYQWLELIAAYPQHAEALLLFETVPAEVLIDEYGTLRTKYKGNFFQWDQVKRQWDSIPPRGEFAKPATISKNEVIT